MDNTSTTLFSKSIQFLKSKKSIIIKVIASFALLFFLFMLSIYLGLFGSLPSKKALLIKRVNQPSEIYSEDGVLLGKFSLREQSNVELKNVPQHVIDALVATEDRRFFKHKGTDASSMMRVLVKSILMQQSSAGGGSTISQQLAKSWYPRKSYWFFETPINKIREMIIAQKIESVFTKEQILEHYLNAVHMGGNHYGIAEGARMYFNKDVDELNLQEAAVLVGMLKASTKYSPTRNPELSKERRNVVFSQMLKYKYITNEEYENLIDKPLLINEGKNNDASKGYIAAYFKEYIKDELKDWCENNENEGGEAYELYQDGLKIYTTINSKAQKSAEHAVAAKMFQLQNTFNSHWRNANLWAKNKETIDKAMQNSHRYAALKESGMDESAIKSNFSKTTTVRLINPYTGKSFKREITPLDSIKYNLNYLHTGLLAIEPSSGKIKAWVGGINQKVFGYDHVLSKRQVGSTFKPILYAAALKSGIKPCTLYENKLKEFDGWTPKNSNNQYGGELTMIQALAQSVNTISAQLIDEVGIRSTKSMAEDLGIESEMPNVPSLSLGAAEISLFEMVNAYATLANNGVKVKPYYLTRITDFQGKELERFIPEQGEETVEPNIAQMMVEMLKAVVNYGSAKSLRSEYNLKMDIAGKTGTTQNQGDGWFIGIIPNLVAGVWVGGESTNIRFRTLELGQGAKTALPVWATFIKDYAASQPSIAYSIFKPLPANLTADTECIQSVLPPEPIEEPVIIPTREEKRGIFRKIFGGKGKGARKNKKRRGKKK